MQGTCFDRKKIVRSPYHQKSRFTCAFMLILGFSLAWGQGATTPVTKEPSAPVASKGKKSKYADSFFASASENKEKSEKDLKLVLAGLNSLIRVEKPGAKKNDLLISRAATLLSLGKHYYLTGKSPEDKATKEAYLKKAMNSAAEAGNTPYATSSTKARALHVYGMSSLYMNSEGKAVEYFEQAIKMDPKSNISPRLSVFIAEYYFDKEKYELALPFYGQFFDRMTSEERALAIYKSGWCFLVLKQFENAEKAFLKLVGKKWAGDFAADGLRDLAQTVTSHRTEQQILQFGVENFSKAISEHLVTFYTDCFMIFLRQSANVDRLALYNEILRLEKLPEKKVALAVKKMSSHQKGFATQQVFRDVAEIEGLILQGALKPETDSFRYFGGDLETEIKRSISSYVDTISKKVKTPEPTTDNELAVRLQKFLWYHVTWFPNSPSLHQTYMIAMDNCTFLKDAECSLRIGRLVLRQEKLKDVWPRARIEILISLETLLAKDSKYKTEYVGELKNYADTQMNAKEWLIFTKKLTVIYVTDKLFAEAEPYLIKIMKKEYTAESLYRKIYCQFQIKKFSEIVVHINQIPKEGSLAVEIKTLIRESSLALAKDFSDQKKFPEYEKYLFQFLDLQPDPDKADLAMADYVQKLLDRQTYDKVITFFKKIPASKKFNGVFTRTMEQLLILLFSMNRFQEASDVLEQGSIFGQYRAFDSYWLRTLLAMKGTLTEKDLKILATSTAAVRTGFLSLAAVSQPRLVIDYFSAANPIDEREKKIWLLSRQMMEGGKSIVLQNREQSFLMPIMTPDSLPMAPLKSERLTKMIEFPQPRWSQERLARVTPDAMERVKSVRRQLLKDLKGKPMDVQKRLIVNGILVEKKMAWFFDESPIPEGLSAEELSEYKKEVDSFASEYYQQANEYQKLLGALVSKENELMGNHLPLPNNMDRWTRNRVGPLNLVEMELSKKNYLKSLILLENQRSLEKVTVDDFYRWRSYIIIKQFPHDLASGYLQEELEAYKQVAVLSEWKKVVGFSARSEREVAQEKDKEVKDRP